MAVELNESNFEQETEEGLVVLDFYADWCAPCRMIAPILEEVEGAKICKVNIDKNQELTARFRVSAIPKLVFLCNGLPSGEMIGLQTPDAVQRKIDEIRSQL